MSGQKENKWFETMQREEIKPSYKAVVRARQKVQKTKERKEFLEEYLPIIMICGMNMILGIILSIVSLKLAPGFSQKVLLINVILGISYLPLLAFSITTIYTKSDENNKEESI